LTHVGVPSRRGHTTAGSLMYDVAALAISAACLAFAFALVYLLGKV
jgi:hypothetical protein